MSDHETQPIGWRRVVLMSRECSPPRMRRARCRSIAYFTILFPYSHTPSPTQHFNSNPTRQPQPPAVHSTTCVFHVQYRHTWHPGLLRLFLSPITWSTFRDLVGHNHNIAFSIIICFAFISSLTGFSFRYSICNTVIQYRVKFNSYIYVICDKPDYRKTVDLDILTWTMRKQFIYSELYSFSINICYFVDIKILLICAIACNNCL